MIELKNVTKYFKTKNEKRYILKNVSLTIPEKVNVGILGINGAGKSTLLRMLGKIDFPNSGKIISKNSFSWPLGLSGGFQGSMTGKQNVKFVARIYGKDEKEIKKIVDFVKNFSELGDYFDMPIKTYSSGMKSRLSFALSLAFDFDYILIDETLSVGDARFKEKSKKALMEKIKESNVLMVSHSMVDLKKICDVGIVLHEGKIEYYDNIIDAIDRYNYINLFNNVSNEDIINMFLRERAKFDLIVKESFLIENQECYYLYFVLKYINKILVFKFHNEFLCAYINNTITQLCNDTKLDLVIGHLIGFFKRFNTKFIFNNLIDEHKKDCLLKCKKVELIKKIKNNNLEIIENDNLKIRILNKLNKLSIIKGN
ncbi:ABC transporter ATP-binding protein [Caminibacter mediatlanticus TB-2]|uniref:ABC transporter ATP-binding protein n=1 Tax=Caminibacter mediatlanticus TB-2 TaxID=391592 RepID=A0ABX5V8T7_9BACT|nr:ABC transporter ATP-binding protein [Caminibacter mediatlanticus]QCT94700.1 ABC transporter ATP-binding protein [Caminibacter mediatlanticus TB-2]